MITYTVFQVDRQTPTLAATLAAARARFAAHFGVAPTHLDLAPDDADALAGQTADLIVTRRANVRPGYVWVGAQL